MTPAALKDLRRLVQLGNGRVELFKGPSWEKHHLLFGQHDLVVWPTLFEDVGLIGLGSIYMGTPVLAFDMPLIGEYLKDGVNGVLVPCDLDYRWPGAAQVTPNYRVFGEYLESMLDRPEYLTKLRQSVHTGVQSRRDTFFTRWQKLLVG
jgi:glycosyltransferase involved in cell wall biosynthesis